MGAYEIAACSPRRLGQQRQNENISRSSNRFLILINGESDSTRNEFSFGHNSVLTSTATCSEIRALKILR